ncbi:MAG: class I SAM-dependent methyltransferase [Methanotrichaceae archaeon]
MKKDATDQTIHALLAHLDLKGKQVLEVGCGDGRITRDLAVHADSVVAFDPDLKAIHQAKMNCQAASFLICAGENLSFRNSSFDLVIFSFSLHHVPIPLMNQALGEAARVLVPSGKIVIIEPLERGSFAQAWNILGSYEGQEQQAAQKAIHRLEGWTVSDDVFFESVFELENAEELCERICGEGAEVPEELVDFLERHRNENKRIVLKSNRRLNVLKRK